MYRPSSGGAPIQKEARGPAAWRLSSRVRIRPISSPSGELRREPRLSAGVQGGSGGALALERRRRRSRQQFLGLVVAIGLLVAASLRWADTRSELSSAFPIAEGELAVPGLEAPVAVVRDRHGVPHVRAESEPDAWFALGFCHAQDRLGQLIYLRRLASGRAAEIAGSEGLAADRWARTVGFARLGQQAERDLRPDERAVLEAYALGVNAWLAELRAGRAAAPRGLDDDVSALADWLPADSLALLKLHAFQLGAGLEEILVLEQLLRQLGAARAGPFFPSSVVDPPGRAHANTRPSTVLSRSPLRELTGLAGRSIGSSAWVVGGSVARRRRPLVAGDLHTQPRVPAHTYQAHLAGGSFEVAGATLPGIPAFWVGFNSEVVWAATHAPIVVADLVEETLNASNQQRYREGSTWQQLTTHIETIAVRGAPDETLEVRATPRGPLVDGLLGADRPLSLRWTGALPGGGISGLLGVARARSSAELRQALARHHEPVLSVVFADEAGAGGLQLAGSVPRRRLATGLQPVPSGDPAYGWDGVLSPAELPGQQLGAETRWLVAADEPYPRVAALETFWRAGRRAEQVRRLLAEAAAQGPIDLEKIVQVQRDVASPASREVIPTALELAGADLQHEEGKLAEILRSWDGLATPESRGAAAYNIFLARLTRTLLASALSPKLLAQYLALPRAAPTEIVIETLRAAAAGGDDELPWSEPTFAAEAVRRSLRETWLELSAELGPNEGKWAWGRLHRVRFQPLWPSAWSSRDPRIGPFAHAGDESSVAVGEYAPGGYETRVAATYRLAADAGNLDLALTSQVPGQSEHADHPNATDGIDRWREGRPSLLSISDPVIHDGPVASLRLLPAAAP